MTFGEKKTEQGLPVWQSPKYEESKAKAIETINSQKYGLTEGDFWILMNKIQKGEKMAYTGLILSHNGCLKINDRLESKFDPSCVTFDKEGYGNSLVFTYCNPEQGIYEVGEVSKTNCKNEYPYAMAFKRLFDRVVLKLSKLAYSGIYSDSESDEFVQRFDDVGNEKKQPDTTAAEAKNPKVNADHLNALRTTYEMVHGKKLTKGLMKEFSGMSSEEAENMTVQEWAFLMDKLDLIGRRNNGFADS